MKCKNCGADVGSEYRLCPYCMTELDYPKEKPDKQPIIIQNIVSNNNLTASGKSKKYVSPKRKKTALILCLCGGYIGLHHFYSGKIGMGILYFLTVGLGCIGWIYDIFKILSGTYRDGLGLPISE